MKLEKLLKKKYFMSYLLLVYLLLTPKNLNEHHLSLLRIFSYQDKKRFLFVISLFTAK